MRILTEPIGSIPRPKELIEAIANFEAGRIPRAVLDAEYEKALSDTIQQFEATDSPVITDGEQSKPSFLTYPVHGLPNISPDGVTVSFADGHTRRLPRLTSGPFRYKTYAASYLEAARKYRHHPMKQAVISASALSLLYPEGGIPGYSRDQFLSDLIDEAEKDIRGCLEVGAVTVQIDFTEARLSLKFDATGQLLRRFVDLNNRVLQRFSPEQRRRVGVHTCPGGDRDSTHSADVDYARLLPVLFGLDAGRFYLQLASEPDHRRVLSIVRDHAPSNRIIFVGVTDPTNPRVETPEEVRDRVLEAAQFIPPERLGTTDDCGFSPFSDDTSTDRKTAFAKIRSRVLGTDLAAKSLSN